MKTHQIGHYIKPRVTSAWACPHKEPSPSEPPLEKFPINFFEEGGASLYLSS